jgi:hypothetical protein
MLESAIGSHELIQHYVDVQVALLVIELAKRAEDSPEWFPHGKWATIQEIKAAADKQLDHLFQPEAKT